MPQLEPLVTITEQAASTSETDKANRRGGARALASLSKGLTILLQLRQTSNPIGLSEISRVLHIKKATAFRVLTTLEQFQFVERTGDDKRYRIGKNAFYVGSGFFSGGWDERIRQTMKRLAQECKHTVTLSLLDGSSVLFVDRVDGESRVRVSVEVGSRVPAYASASGKVLLAGFSDKEIKARFKWERFQRRTSRTVRSVNELLAHLATVRTRGIAFNNEESMEGLCALSVPVRIDKDDRMAALTVAYPADSLTDREQTALAEKVNAAARHIGLERNYVYREAPQKAKTKYSRSPKIVR